MDVERLKESPPHGIFQGCWAMDINIPSGSIRCEEEKDSRVLKAVIRHSFPSLRSSLPFLRHTSLDILSIPAISAKVEHLFSWCKRIITDDQNSLEPDTIEAFESLKSFNRRISAYPLITAPGIIVSRNY